MNPEKRYKKAMWMANFDKGLKEARGIDYGDPEYYADQNTKEIKCNGIRIKVLFNKKRESEYRKFCDLKGCKRKFSFGQDIIGVHLLRGGIFRSNDRGKPYWICYSHVRNCESDSSNDESESSDNAD